jgi:hypothetical protein
MQRECRRCGWRARAIARNSYGDWAAAAIVNRQRTRVGSGGSRRERYADCAGRTGKQAGAAGIGFSIAG